MAKETLIKMSSADYGRSSNVNHYITCTGDTCVEVWSDRAVTLAAKAYKERLSMQTNKPTGCLTGCLPG